MSAPSGRTALRATLITRTSTSGSVQSEHVLHNATARREVNITNPDTHQTATRVQAVDIIAAVAARDLRTAAKLFRTPDWSATAPDAAAVNLELGWLAVRLQLPLGAEPVLPHADASGQDEATEEHLEDPLLSSPDVRAERCLQHAVAALLSGRYASARQALNRAAGELPTRPLMLCVHAHLLTVLSLQGLASQANLAREQVQTLMRNQSPADLRCAQLALSLHHHWAGHPISVTELQQLLTTMLNAARQRDLAYLTPIGLLTLTVGGYADWVTELAADQPDPEHPEPEHPDPEPPGAFTPSTDVACTAVRQVASALATATDSHPPLPPGLPEWARSVSELPGLLDRDPDAAFSSALAIWQRYPAALTEPLFRSLAHHCGAEHAGLHALLPSRPGVGSWLAHPQTPPVSGARLKASVQVLSGQVQFTPPLSAPWPDRAALLLARLADGTPLRRQELHDDLFPEEPREHLGRLITSLAPLLLQHGRTRDRAVQLSPSCRVDSDLQALLSAARDADPGRCLPLLPVNLTDLTDRCPWLKRSLNTATVQLVLMAEHLSAAGEPRPDELIDWLNTQTRLRPWLLEGLNPRRLHAL